MAAYDDALLKERIARMKGKEIIEVIRAREYERAKYRAFHDARAQNAFGKNMAIVEAIRK